MLAVEVKKAQWIEFIDKIEIPIELKENIKNQIKGSEKTANLIVITGCAECIFIHANLQKSHIEALEQEYPDLKESIDKVSEVFLKAAKFFDRINIPNQVAA